LESAGSAGRNRRAQGGGENDRCIADAVRKKRAAARHRLQGCGGGIGHAKIRELYQPPTERFGCNGGARANNVEPSESNMAGHSKWANIKHKKAAQDAKRGKIFTRLIKEITVAARLGGADISTNPRLRLAMDKAMESNMPKDNIERAIKRGSGELEGVSYEEVRYEGYGIAGAAVMVDCMTDNRTRTVADVRHAFTKHGGNLGTDGSVAFLFKHCGQLIFAPGTDEDKLMEAALDAGAEDVVANDDGSIEVITDPNDFSAVKTRLEQAGIKPEFAEVTFKATTENIIAGEDAARMQRLLEALESIDDVQDVYTTAVMETA
jgi:YebC/PmpR family DNA-binding regulatory protein